jgi:phytoene/squalene synthetase
MAQNNGSVKRSKESNDLLNGMKRYLKIEHQDDDNELLEYLRKQAGLHRE